MVESFRAKCDEDEVVMMQHAVYGRMMIGRCVVTEEGGYLGCKSGNYAHFILIQ